MVLVSGCSRHHGSRRRSSSRLLSLSLSMASRASEAEVAV